MDPLRFFQIDSPFRPFESSPAPSIPPAHIHLRSPKLLSPFFLDTTQIHTNHTMLNWEVQELADLNWHRAMREQTRTYRQGQLSKPRIVILIFYDSGFLSIYDDFRASFFLQVLLAGVEPKGCTLPSLIQVLTQVHLATFQCN